MAQTRPARFLRRSALRIAWGAVAAAAFTPTRSWAQGAGQAEPLSQPAADDAFLALSRALTGKTDLSPVTARRILAALVAADAAQAGKLEKLAALVRPGQMPEQLLEAAVAAGLRDPALAIVAAWYTGSVGSGPYATVVAFREALMFRAVADAVPVPTYCGGGPAWWVAAPPALGIPARGEG